MKVWQTLHSLAQNVQLVVVIILLTDVTEEVTIISISLYVFRIVHATYWKSVSLGSRDETFNFKGIYNITKLQNQNHQNWVSSKYLSILSMIFHRPVKGQPK